MARHIATMGDAAEIERLRARVAELEAQVGGATPARAKIDKLSAEVVDSNPYSYVSRK